MGSSAALKPSKKPRSATALREQLSFCTLGHQNSREQRTAIAALQQPAGAVGGRWGSPSPGEGWPVDWVGIPRRPELRCAKLARQGSIRTSTAEMGLSIPAGGRMRQVLPSGHGHGHCAQCTLRLADCRLHTAGHQMPLAVNHAARLADQEAMPRTFSRWRQRRTSALAYKSSRVRRHQSVSRKQMWRIQPLMPNGRDMHKSDKRCTSLCNSRCIDQ